MSNTLTSPQPRRGDWRFTTDAYKRQAMEALICEVNRVASNLDLLDQLPIDSNKVVAVHIPPPALGMLGTLTTRNYTYYVTLGRKFTGMDRRELVASFYQLKSKYLLPTGLMNTNAAFAEASRFMSKAGMDVAALNRDCQVEITASGPYGGKFLPDYWIKWKKGKKRIGFVEFFAPTRELRQLHVWNQSYIMNKPVNVPNLGKLLSDGNAPHFLLETMGLIDTNGTRAHPTNRVPSVDATVIKQ